MPPACNGLIVQCGEPYSSYKGKATYATFEQVAGAWFYRGNCTYKSTIHRIGYYEALEIQGTIKSQASKRKLLLMEWEKAKSKKEKEKISKEIDSIDEELKQLQLKLEQA